MFFGWRNGAAVFVVLLSWLVAAVVPVTAGSTADTAGLLLGLFVVVVAALAFVAAAEDPLFAFGRSIRGPTSEERRLRGGFRRHSHPDTAGRPRPRSPGSVLALDTPSDEELREIFHVRSLPPRHTRRVRPKRPPLVR
ncbi:MULTISPECIES: DUF6412 domain-containing protein [Rhodococcus]|uniref:DUF6412 domain-containing protein n=1 Tax=Rhodococcus TaxID=1827 RepID=UPI000313D9A5|nr:MULTISPECIES: DUF6412 domain-containing protein [Rhodococcus]MXQ75314.1 hypothetical protein [Rhodococcus rhodochrous]OWY79018.1 hypothetical protein B9C99_25080 [Rhodococcus sp. BUPNP1]BDB61507.1 hypothetical protein RDE2_33010 [Rhodococcus sp. RDE2]